MSSPLRPCLPLPLPWVPLPAPRCGWSLNAISEETLWLTTSHTSPPLPPSPPSGPPIGVCASRRNDTLPAPPSPPLTWSPHSSTNCDPHPCHWCCDRSPPVNPSRWQPAPPNP